MHRSMNGEESCVLDIHRTASTRTRSRDFSIDVAQKRKQVCQAGPTSAASALGPEGGIGNYNVQYSSGVFLNRTVLY